MSWGAVAGAAVVTVGGLVASNQKAQAAKGAANAQKSATKTALAEEQRQFDIQFEEYQRKQQLLEQQNEQIRTNLAPYIQAGQGALFEMMALSGLAIPAQPAVPQTFRAPTPSATDQRKLLPAPTVPAEAGKMGILSGGKVPSDRRLLAVTGTVTAPPVQIGGQVAEAVPSGTAAGPFGFIREAVTPVVKQAVGQAYQDAQPLPVTPAPTSQYAGMTGEKAQEAAISKIAQSPLLEELTRQGEEAILQNAAATGGLRGGNVQGILARYRPQMLQEEIEKQYARLAGISGMGQSAISQTPTQVSVGQTPMSNAAQYYSKMGDIEGARILTEAEAQGQALGALGKGLGTAAGAYYNK